MSDPIQYICNILIKEWINSPDLDLKTLVGRVINKIEHEDQILTHLQQDSRMIQITQGQSKGYQVFAQDNAIINIGNHYHFNCEELYQALKKVLEDISTREKLKLLNNSSYCDSFLVTHKKPQSGTAKTNNSAYINSKETIIGISVYLDTMLIPLGREMGVFENNGLNLKVKYIPWNRIFDALKHGEVSAILGNKNICRYYNQTQTPLKYHENFVFYDGFSIIIRPELIADTYLEKKEKQVSFDTSKEDIIKQTLCQLKDKNIIAAYKTDHYASIKYCLNKIDLIENKDYNIIGQYDPHSGLEAFLNGEGDAYVGGIPQRIVAEKRGMKELISQDQVNLGLGQINGLITRCDTLNISYKDIDKISLSWFETVRLIHDDFTLNSNFHMNRMLECFNRVASLHNLNYEFGDLDFLSHWEKWEKFPIATSESRELFESYIVTAQV